MQLGSQSRRLLRAVHIDIFAFLQVVRRTTIAILLRKLLRYVLHVRVELDFSRTDASPLIYFQTPQNQVFQVSSQALFDALYRQLCVNMRLQLAFGFAEPQRSIAVQHFKEEHTESPHVRLGSVDVIQESFR